MADIKRSKNKLSDYFTTHSRLLNIFGVWTDMRLLRTLPLTITYSVLAILLFIIAPQFCHVVYMYKARDNVVAFADEFYVSVGSILVVFKDYSVIKYRKNIQELLDTMDIEIMQPTQEQKKKIHNIMSIWKRLFRSMIYLQLFFCVCQLSTPIIDKLQSGIKNVPLVDCYPFYIYASPVYELMYFYQSVLLLYLIFHNLLFDTLIPGLMIFCASECEVLFENIISLKSEKSEASYKRKLVRCIKHHEELHRFVTNLEQCFSLIILEEYFCSLISCCTTMFKLSLAEPMTVDFFKVLCYQCVIFLQVFLYCWSGSDLTEKSKKLPLAVYEAFRVQSSKSTKKTVQLFLGKTQKPLIIRTLLFDLSMHQYLQLIRSSFSYYTFLSTLNER